MSQHDHELHDATLSRLYRQGRQSEPTREVDARIRQAAHQAVQRRWPAWWKLASSAAILVLSVSVVLQTLTIAPLDEQDMAPLSSEEAPPAATDQMGEREAAPTPEAELKAQSKSFRPLKPAKQKTSIGTNTQPQSALPRKAMPASPAAAAADSAARRASEVSAEESLSVVEAPASACDRFSPPDSDAEADWRVLAAQLMAQGDREQLDCLKSAYAQRFGKPFPENGL